MSVKIIDSHAHYDDSAFDEDREQLLNSMFETTVEMVIEMGCSLESSRNAVTLAEEYPQIYAAVGIHPEDCDKVSCGFLDELEQLSKNEKVVAIGEIGLDYHYEGFSREKQLEVFEQQLILAQKLDLPVVIHSRDATKDCMEMLRKYKPNGVVHCFSGSAETAKEIVSLGMYIGFTGVLTFKNARKAIEACNVIPTDRLLLETDCPYMAPVPFRGMRCDSTMIKFTAEKMAEIKGVYPEKMQEICNNNAKRLFGIAK